MQVYICCWLILLLVALHTTGTVAKVSVLIVFGDSSVDAGNNNQIPTLARSNFQPYGQDFFGGKPTGRFCNGRLATDFMSEAFGLPATVPAYLDPAMSIKDFATGVCFASAGTDYDNATSDVASVIPLWKELEYFKEYCKRLIAFQGKVKAKKTLREAVYVLSIGTNDFLENYYTFPARRSQFTIEEYMNYLITISYHFLKSIYRLGARIIDLTSLGPMGCLPLERAENMMSGLCNQDYNRVAKVFNYKLQRLADRLNRELPGFRVMYANVYDIFLDIVQRPSLYGFENAERGCCATGWFEMSYMCNQNNPLTCMEANKYVFWDAFHPSERMNLLLANHLMNATFGVLI